MTASSRLTVETKYPSPPRSAAHKIAFSLAIDASKVDRTLALDESYHLRHRILGRNGDHHVHMIRHQMTFLNLALLLHRQFATYLPRDAASTLRSMSFCGTWG